MDKIGADFFMSLESIQNRLSDKAMAIQISRGAADQYTGIIDLLKMK